MDPLLSLFQFKDQLFKSADINKKKTLTYLTSHFTLEELTHTNKKLDNVPKDPLIIKRLQYLCMWILEPVRRHYGKAVRITSGYRSPALNKLIGGATNSQHSKGEAADFHIDGVSNLELARWISGKLTYDQLILEFYKSGIPNSGWVHCSVVSTGNRKQFLIAQKQNGKTIYLPADLSKLS